MLLKRLYTMLWGRRRIGMLTMGTMGKKPKPTRKRTLGRVKKTYGFVHIRV